MKAVFYAILGALTFEASAITPPQFRLEQMTKNLIGSFVFDNTYRIGDEWGKKPVRNIDSLSPKIQRVLHATARVGGATGFYVGKFNGRHIVATNFHVCEDEWSCVGSNARFTSLSRAFRIVKWLGSWNTVDLSLLVIAVDRDEDAELLAANAIPFDWDAEFSRGLELATAGFGIADNPNREVMLNVDSDCKVFSDANEFRLMADPDSLNPGPYRAWSFSNGCDVSHGDSGSAMVDRATGRPVGIIWTGKIPKSPKVQSSAYLNDLMANPAEDIWTELSYGVPAPKMREYLVQWLSQNTVDPDVRGVLSELIR